MSNNGTHKIKQAHANWRQTYGEHILRIAGLTLAAIAIYIGYYYGTRKSVDDGTQLVTSSAPVKKEYSYTIKQTNKPLLSSVLLVAASLDTKDKPYAIAFREAVASYYGVTVTLTDIRQYGSKLVAKHDGVIVYGNRQFKESIKLKHLIRDIKAYKRPVFWYGYGFSEVSSDLGIPYSRESRLQPATSDHYIHYKTTAVQALGIDVVLGKLKVKSGNIKTLASMKANGTSYPLILNRGGVTYVSFLPFRKKSYTLVTAVTINALSTMLGKHKPNPRVIFRLEDVNVQHYGDKDKRFRKTADYLLSQKVHVHIGIIPTMVDASGKVVTSIKKSSKLARYIRKNQTGVSVVQHGSRHHRMDPRNHGMGSGAAFEFFFTDDHTMGAEEARKFAVKRMTEGYRTLAAAGLTPVLFEAPHYELSPGQQKVADQMYPVMHHSPIFYDGKRMNILLPWFTNRNGTVYVPSSLGYIDVANKDSVRDILYQLEELKKIMPDPVVIVFFHPFMIDHAGRETDLMQLITGTRKLGYRFINTADELSRINK
jgi:uncharacterized protein YdaL